MIITSGQSSRIAHDGLTVHNDLGQQPERPGDALTVRVGLFFDDQDQACCARTLEGIEFTARDKTYRKAAGQLRRLLEAHHARPVTIDCDMIVPDGLACRLSAFQEARTKWTAAGKLVRAEAAALVAALLERHMNTSAVAKLMQLTTAQVMTLQRRPTSSTGRRQRGRPRAVARLRTIRGGTASK